MKPPINSSFTNFIFKENRFLVFASVVLLACHYFILKMLFPHTIVIGDGHHYVRVAMNNMEISGWPIGYSKFLEWTHLLAKGDWIVGCLQYILLEGSVLLLYFTVQYLVRPGKWIAVTTLILLLANPFILFISNYVYSDSLFATLTILWFTFTVWYLYKPRPLYAYLLAILFILAYTIRYYAMFYPIISIPVIIISKIRWQVKVLAMALGGILLVGFRWYTENLFEKSIGRREFSPLSGWRLAGNALIMYRHLPVLQREKDIAPSELQSLHQLVLDDLTVMPPPDLLPDRLLVNYFTFQPSSPLSRYCNVFFGDYITTGEIKKWDSVGQLYRAYGLFLIKRHPFAYLRYYVWQGVDWYIHPKVDITNVFPLGGIPILDETKQWFGYSSNWSPCSSIQFYSITYFPIVVTALNLLFILGMLYFFSLGGYKRSSRLEKKVIVLVAVYWLIDFFFVILTTPALLRYALSGMILNIVFVPFLLERVYLLLRGQESRWVPANPP
jgi:hypothetical protein